jgi:hypothetical protein
VTGDVRVNPAEKRPFHQQYRLAGQFVVEGAMTEQVDMVMEFTELDGGRIDGVWFAPSARQDV